MLTLRKLCNARGTADNSRIVPLLALKFTDARSSPNRSLRITRALHSAQATSCLSQQFVALQKPLSQLELRPKDRQIVREVYADTSFFRQQVAWSKQGQ